MFVALLIFRLIFRLCFFSCDIERINNSSNFVMLFILFTAQHKEAVGGRITGGINRDFPSFYLF